MSRVDHSQYTDAVTSFSEGELQDVLSVAEPPVCLLGGWAVHIHVTDDFHAQHGRSYIGSRDVDVGIHADPEWTPAELDAAPVADTLVRIEDDLDYSRGRFGFYQQFHRETGDRLDEAAVRKLPPHEIFRVDVDGIPDTTALDTFEERSGASTRRAATRTGVQGGIWRTALRARGLERAGCCSDCSTGSAGGDESPSLSGPR